MNYHTICWERYIELIVIFLMIDCWLFHSFTIVFKLWRSPSRNNLIVCHQIDNYWCIMLPLSLNRNTLWVTFSSNYIFGIIDTLTLPQSCSKSLKNVNFSVYSHFCFCDGYACHIFDANQHYFSRSFFQKDAVLPYKPTKTTDCTIYNRTTSKRTKNI